MTDYSNGERDDADATCWSPGTRGSKYPDPRYRDRAIRNRADEQGYEVLLIDGQPLRRSAPARRPRGIDRTPPSS